MTPLEALEEIESMLGGGFGVVRFLQEGYLSALCQGYRAALAEIELSNGRLESTVRELNTWRAEADRLAGLLKRIERGDSRVDGYGHLETSCLFCGSESPEPHDDDCPAFTPDGEVKR